MDIGKAVANAGSRLPTGPTQWALTERGGMRQEAIPQYVTQYSERGGMAGVQRKNGAYYRAIAPSLTEADAKKFQPNVDFSGVTDKASFLAAVQPIDDALYEQDVQYNQPGDTRGTNQNQRIYKQGATGQELANARYAGQYGVEHGYIDIDDDAGIVGDIVQGIVIAGLAYGGGVAASQAAGGGAAAATTSGAGSTAGATAAPAATTTGAATGTAAGAGSAGIGAGSSVAAAAPATGGITAGGVLGAIKDYGSLALALGGMLAGGSGTPEAPTLQAPPDAAVPDVQGATTAQDKRTQGATGRSDTIKTNPLGLGEISPDNLRSKSILGY